MPQRRISSRVRRSSLGLMLLCALPASAASRSNAESSTAALAKVTSFATQCITAMGSPSAAAYLSNRALADSSTFVLRLHRTMVQETFQRSPFLPVPERDAACYYGIPPYVKPRSYDAAAEPVNIASDSIQGALSHNVVYQGNVEIIQADRILHADQVAYDDVHNVVTAAGNITLSAPEYTIVTRQPVTYNIDAGRAEAAAADFQLNGSVLRGHVGHAVRDESTKTTVLENLTFTTCPLSGDTWHVSAASVTIADHEAFGSAHDAMLHFGGVPIFYMPYAQFPITSERQSGLLSTSASYSSSRGLDLAQPLYLNLAPNYDMTLTPRIMTRRSVALETELRFMPLSNDLGQIGFNYIPSDNEWEHSMQQSRRWMLSIDNHAHFLNRDLNLDVTYQRVRPGDYDFLSDYGSEHTRVTDNYLLQSLRSTYTRSHYELSAEAREYQQLLPLHAVTAHPFAMLPQLRASFFDSQEHLSYNLDLEATRFDSTYDSTAGHFSATRLHAEPALRYQIFSRRGTVLHAGVRGFLTHYSQDAAHMPRYFRSEFGINSLENNATRALYLLDISGRTTLERPVFDLRHTQTIEPMITYQYIPYTDQHGIGLYDTTDRMTDYYSIFSHRGFTGSDRIADLNRITVGFSTRLLDPHDRELMNLSVGQAYHFVPTRVTLYPDEEFNDYPRSPLAVQVNANPWENVTLHAGMSYTNETNEVTSWDAIAEYRSPAGLMTHVSYRFTQDGNRSLQNQAIDLSQLGLQLSLPLTGGLKAVSAFYRDLEQHHNIDYKFALRYEECCFAVSAVYENYSKTNWHTLMRSDEHVIGLEIEFKGLLKVTVSGTDQPDSTDTYLLSYFNPVNLSQ